MKSIAQIFFWIGVSVFLCGCKKNKSNQIDATIYVKEYKTETPIANAKVLIMRGAAGSGVGSSLVETLYTDNEGKVDYNSNIDEDYMYYAEAYKDKYFDTHNQQVSVTPGKKNFNTTIFMYAESYVKLHVKNANPFDQYDLINIKSTCFPFDIQGSNVDTFFVWCDYCPCTWMGNFNYGASFAITKNNITTKLNFQFTPIPRDTILININY